MRERGQTSGAVFGGGVDHFTHFGDLGGWEAADLGVLPDNRLVLGEIDAEGLVGRDKAFDPLDVGAEFAQDAVRLRRGALQLLALEATDRRNIPLDDEFAQCHRGLPLFICSGECARLPAQGKAWQLLTGGAQADHAPGNRSRGQAMASDPLPYQRPRPGTQPPTLYPDYASTVKRAPKRKPIRFEHTLSEVTVPSIAESWA